MNEFDRSGIAETDVYRSARRYVTLMAAAGLLIGTYRALTSSPTKNAFGFVLGLVLIAIGSFLAFILFDGSRRDRNRRRRPQGSIPQSGSE